MGNFKANNIEPFLNLIGFEKRQVASEKVYFSNEKGNQIKIDKEENSIIFIDRYGFTVGIYDSVDDKDIADLIKYYG